VYQAVGLIQAHEPSAFWYARSHERQHLELEGVALRFRQQLPVAQELHAQGVEAGGTSARDAAEALFACLHRPAAENVPTPFLALGDRIVGLKRQPIPFPDPVHGRGYRECFKWKDFMKKGKENL
jgi:hypothetical protein